MQGPEDPSEPPISTKVLTHRPRATLELVGVPQLSRVEILPRTRKISTWDVWCHVEKLVLQIQVRVSPKVIPKSSVAFEIILLLSLSRNS